MNTDRDCHCIVRHARSPEEREEAQEALAYAKRLKDKQGITIAMLSLGKCPQDNQALRFVKEAPLPGEVE